MSVMKRDSNKARKGRERQLLHLHRIRPLAQDAWYRAWFNDPQFVRLVLGGLHYGPEARMRPVLATNARSGEVREYPSMTEAARAFALSTSSLDRWLNGQGPQPCDQERPRKATQHVVDWRFSWDA